MKKLTDHIIYIFLVLSKIKELDKIDYKGNTLDKYSVEQGYSIGFVKGFIFVSKVLILIVVILIISISINILKN